MLLEYGSITPRELLMGVSPKTADDWLDRIRLASLKAKELEKAGKGSVCVASTIACTHRRIVNNFDFSVYSKGYSDAIYISSNFCIYF